MMLLLLFLLLVPTVSHAQVLYFATYEGTGTEANPFRAHGGVSGTECKSLRANETLVAGLALCSGPSLPVRAGVRQVDLSGPLTAQQKAFLASALGRSIVEVTVSEVLTAVVNSSAMPLRRWSDGRQRIMVKGQEVWSRPAPLASYLPSMRDALFAPVRVVQWLVTPTLAWAASYTESFTATDGVLNGCQARGCTLSWTTFQGSSLDILSNRASRADSVGVQLARAASEVMATDDMRVGATLSTMTRNTATDITNGVIARKLTADNASTYLFCTAAEHSSQDYVVFGHVVAGARTDDGTVNASVAGGDTIQFDVLNDVMVCLHKGVRVLGPFTETTGNGYTEAGIRMAGSGTATGTVTELDNWYARDITSLPGMRGPVGPVVLP